MSITLNVLNGTKVKATHQLRKFETLMLTAEQNENYQLIDNLTGHSPQNILVKREGEDLVITIENGSLRPDIIIEQFYQGDSTTNSLLGMHENGNLYAYVPESAEHSDAVSLLTDEMSASQALGGQEYNGDWEFNPHWLMATVPIVGMISTAIHRHNNEDLKNASKSVLQALENNEITATDVLASGEESVKIYQYAENALYEKQADGTTVLVSNGIALGEGNDSLTLPFSLDGSFTVDGGTGIDTLNYTGLSTLDYSTTISFERVNLEGGSLQLSWNDLQTANLEDTLRISGSGSVDLDTHLIPTEQIVVDNIGYDIYSDGTQQIYIQSDIVVF